MVGGRICVLLGLFALAVAVPLGSQDAPTFMAGASKINASLPVGIPLAGYNHGERRVPHFPIPHKTKYTTFMTPSVGILEPTWAKALVLRDADGVSIAWATFDGIGMDGSLATLAHDIAAKRGFTVPFENLMMSGSHSHSGPGAVSPQLLWEYAPAMDLLVPELRDQMANSMADALLEAEKNLKPAKLGVGLGNLTTVTNNRRAGHSPYLHRDSIDPNLGVLRVDAEDGSTIATLWNFAVHGTCYGESNLKTSGDIMGVASMHIEDKNGGVALFINADAGDISPTHEACQGAPTFNGSSIIGDAVTAVRAATTPSANVSLHATSKIVEFGKTELNLTLSRLANCTTGPLCGMCEAIHCSLNLHLGPKWVEESPKFTAFRIVVDGVPTAAVSLPGEPLSELGFWVRDDAASMGYHQTLLCGYTNNHMGYFCTPREYVLGGYESELTFWGIDTAVKMRESAKSVLATL